MSAAFSPPPPEGFISPMMWGVEANVVERFGQAGVPTEKVSMVKDAYAFVSPTVGPEEYIDLFIRFYGPTMNAFEAAAKNGKADELRKELVELAKSYNKGTDSSTSISATFLRVTVAV